MADINEGIEDPIERMLKKTGCIDHHYAVQACFLLTDI